MLCERSLSNHIAVRKLADSLSADCTIYDCGNEAAIKVNATRLILVVAIADESLDIIFSLISNSNNSDNTISDQHVNLINEIETGFLIGTSEKDLLSRIERFIKLAQQRKSNVTNESGHIFLATDLSVGDATPDETEQLAIRRLPLEEAFEMAADGSITDCITLAGLLRLQNDILSHRYDLPR